VISGWSATPYTQFVKGVTMSTSSFKQSANGQIVARVNFSQPQAARDGFRVLAKTYKDLVRYCESFGLKEVRASGSDSIQEIYVTQSQSFFDPFVEKIVFRTDEHVGLSNSVECEGEIMLDL
jgi:hypothetical protein